MAIAPNVQSYDVAAHDAITRLWYATAKPDAAHATIGYALNAVVAADDASNSAGICSRGGV